VITLSKKQRLLVRQIGLHALVIGLLAVWLIAINRTADQYLSGVKVIVDQIEGERDLITNKDIKHLITRELPNDVMTQSITRIDIGMIEEMLRADTRIFKVEVFVDAHQQLVAEVIQRRPVLRVINQEDDQYYVDQAGDYIRRVQNKASRVPVITGYVEPYGTDKDINKLPRLKKAFDITMQIRKDPVLRALVEQIHFEKNSRIVLIPKIGDEKIILDHIDQLDEKLDNLKEFYKYLARTNSWDKYNAIDISYSKQVVIPNSENP